MDTHIIVLETHILENVGEDILARIEITKNENFPFDYHSLSLLDQW